MTENITNVVDRMAEIRQLQEQLSSEYDSLQAVIFAEAEKDLSDTKLKSVRYSGTDSNKATVTSSDTVSVKAGELLEEIFDKVFPSMAEKKITYTLKAPAKKILTAIWNREYCKGTVEDVINSLDYDEGTRKVLLRKVKGTNFDKDKENLMNFAGFSEEEASDTAYLASEVAAWNDISNFIKVNHGEVTDEILSDIISKTHSAVSVSRNIKTEITIGDTENG